MISEPTFSQGLKEKKLKGKIIHDMEIFKYRICMIMGE